MCALATPLADLPASLHTLILPAHLHTLVGAPVEQAAAGGLPQQLRQLRLPSWFNAPLGALPQSLEVLHLGKRFNQPLGVLPDLTGLHLGDCFNRGLGKLPQSLSELKVGTAFNHDICPLPLQLVVLDLSEATAYDQLLPVSAVSDLYQSCVRDCAYCS
jgi:FNIP Repeat